MAAPLPLRFYNPVKDLCKKANLDYETVIGTAVIKTRDAYVNAEIQKPLDQIKSEDRRFVKHKMDFLDRKYGVHTATGGSNAAGSTGGEDEDKGAIRYAAGLIVESICPDTSKMDESSTTSSSNASGFHIGERRTTVWVPGKGIVNR
jgi:hypothetical protein